MDGLKKWHIEVGAPSKNKKRTYVCKSQYARHGLGCYELAY